MSDSDSDSDEDFKYMQLLSRASYRALKDQEATGSSYPRAGPSSCADVCEYGEYSKMDPRETPTAGPNMCTDTSENREQPKIELPLTLNPIIKKEEDKLHSVLQDRFFQCQQLLAKIENTGDERYEQKENFIKFESSPPDNEDTILMKTSNLFNFTTTGSLPRWMIIQKNKLFNIILKLAKEKRKQEIISKISQPYRVNKSSTIKKNKKVDSELNKKLRSIEKMNPKEIVGPIDEEYDWNFIASQMNNSHSAQEYRALWKLFLHPSINKSPFSQSEHMLLQKIAHEKNLQDWDAISRELNTGRTSFQCFDYYRNKINNPRINQIWTKVEEQKLMKLIEYHRNDNHISWTKVGDGMDNRTKKQAYNKCKRLCILRKGKFLPEEDSVILTCVKHFGLDFKKVQAYLPGRSMTQCRERYQLLKKKRYSAVWTVDEDRKLLQLMSNQNYQNASISFSIVSKYFPGKDRMNIRTRYMTLCKWMRGNPNVDIAKAPRRISRCLGHAKSEKNLNRAVKNLKKRLKREIRDKKNKKKKITTDSLEDVIVKKEITKHLPEDVIDYAIEVFLTTENAQQMKVQSLQSCQDEQDSVMIGEGTHDCNFEMLRKVLIILKAKLNKEKFANSNEKNTYQGLLNVETLPSTVQIRSYSKKDAITNLVLDKKLDIWGETTLEKSSYVLPPNYQTIRGLQTLMSYQIDLKREHQELKNLNALLKRNPLTREQFELLKERFEILFRWPMILLHEPPEHFKSNKMLKASAENSERIVFGNKEELNFFPPRFSDLNTIKEGKEGNVEDPIDLEESDLKDKQQININFDTID